VKIGNLGELEIRAFLDRLGLVLVVDNCRRGCLHCPAYGTVAPVAYMDPRVMGPLLRELESLFRASGLPQPRRTIHCWRVSDPLDYFYRAGPRLYDMVYVAELWTRYLGQGLYMVTNGSEGKARARQTLRDFVQHPEFISQAKLTITPCDVDWGTERYRRDLLYDIETMAPLWYRRANRIEDSRNSLFRINVKSTAPLREKAREFVYGLLQTLSLDADALIGDPSRICFKAIYDLGTATGADSPVVDAVSILNGRGERYKAVEGRRQDQTGIRPNLTTFQLDMYSFAESPFLDERGDPVAVSLSNEPEFAAMEAAAV
jgi:hypothetical protein